MRKRFKNKTLGIFLALVLMLSTIPPAVAIRKPVKVPRLKATAQERSVKLSWKKARYAKKYRVYQKKKGWSDWKKTSAGNYQRCKHTDGYKVKKVGKKYYYSKYGKGYICIKTLRGKSYTVRGLKPNTSYKFKVVGVNGNKMGKPSRVVYVKTKKKSSSTKKKNEPIKSSPGYEYTDVVNDKSKESTLDENRKGTFVDMSDASKSIIDNTTYMKETTGTKTASGISNMTIRIFTDGGMNWLKNQGYEFAVKDVTPQGYKDIFQKLGYKSGVEIKSVKYVKDEDPECNDIIINLEAQPATQAIKLYDKNGKNIEINPYRSVYSKVCYIFPSEEDSENKPYPFLTNVYKTVRHKVEAQIWTSNMSTLEKVTAMSNYIDDTVHNELKTVRKETNPEFWDRWSVDGLFNGLGSNMEVLPDIAFYQGYSASCDGAYRMQKALVEDLGVKQITKDTKGQEGVYVGQGAYSSTPDNPDHVTLIYVASNGLKYFMDVPDGRLGCTLDTCKCSQHHCLEKIVDLSK